jgi:exopolyphosphatase / guanosine-5'-triphosphate,3'-diphosphate pyrophosphatase
MDVNDKILAAIDIGSNSFHLIVVKVKDDGNFEIIDSERDVIRLAEGSSGNIKYIKPAAIERALATLKNFKVIADSYNAKIRAVATSAVREAYNKNEFIELVFDKTGIDVEVINGYEEARLIYLGAMRAVPVYNKKTLLIDIGGGSTELLVGYKGKSNFALSLKLGAVRLTERFFPDYELSNASIKECRKWVEIEVFQAANSIQKLGFSTCVGTSGTIMAAGMMINAMRKGSSLNNHALNNFEFTKKELDKVCADILDKKHFEKRKKAFGLDAKRADIIPAGMIILSTIFDLLHLDKMLISGYALREGIIIDTLQKTHTGSIKPDLSDIRTESVKQLAESCRYDHLHCQHIAKLSLEFFDQLKVFFNFEVDLREYLHAAAILHDVGYHISHTNHHHHSYYIIKNSELLGFNENEISIIAHVARYHRKSHPKTRHEDFSELPERTQNIIKQLAAILRVTDSFDRTHKQIIQSLKVKVSTNTIELNLECKKGAVPDIELWNLERRKGLFEEVFNKKLKVVCS